MKALLPGANGRLGWELRRTCPDDIILAFCDFAEVAARTRIGIRPEAGHHSCSLAGTTADHAAAACGACLKT